MTGTRFPAKPETRADLEQLQRILIVNADDFGLCRGVNRGIVRAHDEGIVTSASLMVNRPAAEEAAVLAAARPKLSVGLHLDFGEWIFRSGQWEQLDQVVDTTEDAMAVEREAERQLDRFRELLGSDPSHLDSHQHVHLEEPLRSVTERLGRELGVPVRRMEPEIRYEGGFYGQADEGEPYPELVGPEALRRLITELPPGVTELGCHPGLEVDVETQYRAERELEVSTLCDGHVREAIERAGVQLISFRETYRPVARHGHIR